ncbi:hypothetical protein DL93DRAFT_2085673 [Clavulina sp. PMI_390]|nr:hypothetical protein DL93DRAFT_2085673 [Clavulina sp. PMI_390]
MRVIRKARFTLAVVCKRWREVALSSQSLWSVILIAPRKKSGFHSDLFNEELNRSGNSLLSVLITDPFGLPRNPRPEIIAGKIEIVRAAKEVLPRCKDIIIHGNQVLVARMLSPLSDVPLPNLQSIYASSHLNDISPHINRIDLSSAVALSSLRFHFSAGEHPIRLSVSPDANLRCVEVSSPIVPQDIVDILAHAPLLEEFTWTTLESIPSQSLQKPLPQMTYLRQLVLYGEIPLSILGSFQAPQLTILEIIYRGPDDSAAPSLPFPTLASISFPHLRILYIDGYRRMIRNYEPSIVGFLRAHPTLQVVSLSEHVTEPLVEALCAIPSLSYVSSSNDEDNDTHALPLIRKWHARSISSQGCRLPALYLDQVHYPNLWDSEELRNDPELLEFAQKILVYVMFSQREGLVYWGNFLRTMGHSSPGAM